MARTLRKRDLYMVVGYDETENQAFWDLIPARSPEAALERFRKARGEYAWPVDVLSTDTLYSMAAKARDTELGEAERWLQTLDDYKRKRR